MSALRRRFRRAAAAVFAAAACGWFVLALVAAARPARPAAPFFDPPVRNLAHRGGALLGPEETLAAFATSAGHGIDALDMDVRLSADGEVVVFHDPTLDRTTDGSGPVAERTLEELRELNAGHGFRDREGRFPFRGDAVRIPTLTEVFAAHPGRRMVIEMKVGAAAEPLCDLIRSFGKRHEIVVAAFPQDSLDVFRRNCPETATAAGFAETAGFLVLSWLGLEGLFPAGPDALLVAVAAGPVRVVTPRFLRAARRVGLPVVVWTVNDPAEMRRLLDLGVDGILTDDPATLRKLLEEGR